MINIKVTDKTGEVVTVRAVDEEEQLMMITKNGVVNRQHVSEIRVIGRATQGVKLMNLDDGDVVVDVARVIIDDDDEDDQPEGVEGDVEGAEEGAPTETPEAETDTDDAAPESDGDDTPEEGDEGDVS